MKLYVAPTIVEFGKAIDVVKGCGGWGCESGFTNHSYHVVSDGCRDTYWGESGLC
ncbi:hypothetical protein [Bacillus toyonensis]|uniref:hypothetical protein n=1 Tax=Bacillus toyonensis TaxID=155322 RepID=UPI001596EA76|nr:hypothetical protein [Bacillus toyonensis]